MVNIKICKCHRCEYFEKADWSWGTLEQKIYGVTGFCMDDLNPDFNSYARVNGRGIGKMEAILSPIWCRLRK